MITPFEVYLVMKADIFGNFLAALSIIPFLILTVYVCTNAQKGNESEDLNFRYMVFLLSISIFFFIAAVAMPTTKTLTAMYIIPKLSNSEVVKNIPNYLQQYIEKELKDNTSQ